MRSHLLKGSVIKAPCLLRNNSTFNVGFLKEDLSQSKVFLWSLSKANIRFSRSASCHLAVRSGLGSVVAAVSGLWRDSWWKAEWRSGCRRRWNLDSPIRQRTSTSGWQRKHGDNHERILVKKKLLKTNLIVKKTSIYWKRNTHLSKITREWIVLPDSSWLPHLSAHHCLWTHSLSFSLSQPS